MTNQENRERESNKGNLGAELESLRSHKSMVEDRELFFLYNIMDSALEKLDAHLKREGESS